MAKDQVAFVALPCSFLSNGRGLRGLYGCRATRKEVVHNRNERQDQKDVYEACGHMKGEESTQPHEQQNEADNSKHIHPPMSEIWLSAPCGVFAI
jgi:hypothetical protein